MHKEVLCILTVIFSYFSIGFMSLFNIVKAGIANAYFCHIYSQNECTLVSNFSYSFWGLHSLGGKITRKPRVHHSPHVEVRAGLT